jgi:tRNA A-37 threonylcarbamoyl transferase component Bud32
MAWIEIMAGYAKLFGERRWESAAPFLDWTGVLVNKHRDRQVEQVAWTDQTEAAALPRGDAVSLACASDPEKHFFLKKETRVRWRERFQNAWHGFGWCANSVREAGILRAARDAGVGCPEVAAFGEDEPRAFVLLRDQPAMLELRTFLPTLQSDLDRNRLADALGGELARLHNAGFDHPDLFAKHILAARFGPTFRFCILDWARARRRRNVSWRLRCRDLAVLDATLHESLASDRLRVRCLRAYLRARTGAPPLGRIARQIRREARRLQARRNVREIGQPATPGGDQQLVPMCAGRLLVVRTYYDQCRGALPEWLTLLPTGGTPAEDFCLTAARGTSAAEWRLQTWPLVSPRWEMPPLAHLLFRLQRFGVRAPRLRAVGASILSVFLLTEAPATVSFEQAFARASAAKRRRLLEQAGQLIRQVHEAGYLLPAHERWGRRLGIAAEDGAVVLAQVEPLERGPEAWQDRAPTEFNRQNFILSRREQWHFLRGYLGRRRLRNDATGKCVRSAPPAERQAAA